jgi:hypothetical protein
LSAFDRFVAHCCPAAMVSRIAGRSLAKSIGLKDCCDWTDEWDLERDFLCCVGLVWVGLGGLGGGDVEEDPRRRGEPVPVGESLSGVGGLTVGA